MSPIRRLGALLVCLMAASAAQAGTLASATWLQVTQGFPMTRTTTQLGASGTSTASSIAVSLAYPAFSVTFFDPKTSMGVIDLHFRITQGGPQAITATPAMAFAATGVPGTVIVMTANHVQKGVNASMYNPGVNTLVKIPVTVGVAGGVSGSTFIIIGETHTITVDFYAWTPRTLTFTGLTSKGVAFGGGGPMALPDVVAMGSFDLTAMGAGTVTLVSPTKVSIDGRLSQRRAVSFSTLKLTFVPEPVTVLLLGAAAAALVLARRR